MITKICTTCKQEKSISEFYINKDNNPVAECKECRRRRTREYNKNNPEKVKQTQQRTYTKYRDKRRQTRINEMSTELGYKKYWLHSSYSGHSKKYDMRATKQEIFDGLVKDCKVCALCGIELKWWKEGNCKGPIANSPTLDRINNDNYITLDNIQILCNQCNTMKNNKSMPELIEWCKMIISRNDGENLKYLEK